MFKIMAIALMTTVTAFAVTQDAKAIDTFVRNGTLYVYGTAGNDHVRIQHEDGELLVLTYRHADDFFEQDNETVHSSYATRNVAFISVALGAGDDTHHNSSNIRSEQAGEGGSDVLIGGSNADVLLGHGGEGSGDGAKDYLYGAGSRGNGDQFDGGDNDVMQRGNPPNKDPRCRD